MRVSVGRWVTFLPLALGHEFKSHIRTWPPTRLWFSSSSGRPAALPILWCMNFTTPLGNKLKVLERKGESKRSNSHYSKNKNKNLILEIIEKEKERRFSHARYSLHLSSESCSTGCFFPQIWSIERTLARIASAPRISAVTVAMTEETPLPGGHEDVIRSSASGKKQIQRRLPLGWGKTGRTNEQTIRPSSP